MFRSLKNLFSIADMNWLQALTALILFSANSLFDLLGILFVGPFISAAIGDYEKIPTYIQEMSRSLSDDLLLALFIIIIFVAILKLIIQSFVSYFIIISSQNQQRKLRNALLLRYSSLKLSDSKQSYSSDLFYAIQNLSPRFSKILIAVFKTVSDTLMATVLIGYMLINFTYIVLILIFLIGSFLILYERNVGPILKINGQKLNIAGTFLLGLSQQIVDGFEEIKTYRKTNFFHSQIQRESRKVQTFQSIQGILQTWPRIFVEFFIVVFTVSIILYYASQDGSSNVFVTLAVFGFSAIRLIPAISQFTVTMGELRFEAMTLENLLGALRREEAKHTLSSNADIIIEKKIQSLEMCSVEVKVGTKILLKSFSYEFIKGSVYGIKGPSGFGKTTLVNTLIGLNEFSKGKILMNGKEIVPVHIDLYLQSARIPQFPSLFNFSIETNITLEEDQSKIDTERLGAIIKSTGLQILSSQLKGEAIGERGNILSGGQRQRVAIARALYHKRQLIIMDEATNALDHESESEILNLVKSLKKNHIVILISHSQDALNECDITLDLKDFVEV